MGAGCVARYFKMACEELVLPQTPAQRIAKSDLYPGINLHATEIKPAAFRWGLAGRSPSLRNEMKNCRFLSSPFSPLAPVQSLLWVSTPYHRVQMGTRVDSRPPGGMRKGVTYSVPPPVWGGLSRPKSD